MDQYQKYLLELSQRMQSLADWSAQELEKMGTPMAEHNCTLRYDLHDHSLKLGKLFDTLNVPPDSGGSSYWKSVDISPSVKITIFHNKSRKE